MKTANLILPTVLQFDRSDVGCARQWAFLSAWTEGGSIKDQQAHRDLNHDLFELCKAGDIDSFHYVDGVYKGQHEAAFAILLPEHHGHVAVRLAAEYGQESVLLVYSSRTAFAILLPEHQGHVAVRLAAEYSQESVLRVYSSRTTTADLAGALHYPADPDGALGEVLPGRFTTFDTTADISADVDAYTRFADGSAFAFV